MSKSLTGACLCGGVEYEVRDPEGMGICHCTRCQRWTGSSLAAVLVDPDNFEITKGRDLVKRYESELAPRHFCGNCGACLYDDLALVDDPRVARTLDFQAGPLEGISRTEPATAAQSRSASAPSRNF